MSCAAQQSALNWENRISGKNKKTAGQVQALNFTAHIWGRFLDSDEEPYNGNQWRPSNTRIPGLNSSLTQERVPILEAVSLFVTGH